MTSNLMSSRKFLGGMMMALWLGIAGSANAGGWKPDGALSLQIGFGAGGSTDTMGRVLAKVMADQTGWDIIAENKTGGGGVAMFTGIAKMPPNGRVIGLGVNMPILVNLVRRGDELPFDLDSFAYLGTISKAELALVAASDAPFDDLEGLIKHARMNGSLPVAYGAPPQKLLMDVAARETGAKPGPSPLADHQHDDKRQPRRDRQESQFAHQQHPATQNHRIQAGRPHAGAVRQAQMTVKSCRTQHHPGPASGHDP